MYFNWIIDCIILMKSEIKIVICGEDLYMEKIAQFGTMYIAIAVSFVIIVKEIIESNKDECKKTIVLSISYFMNYTLLLYCYRFVSWTIEFEKFHRYPYKNPFCIFVFVCCIIVFVILGIYYIKYQKNIYGIKQTLLLFIAIHILAILLLILLRVPMFLGLTGIY